MKIALDAMGGDFGPPNLVAGAVMALRNYRQINKLYLVGDSAKVENELRKHQCSDSRIEIVHSTQVVDMSDRAWTAVRRKKDSSISRAVDLTPFMREDILLNLPAHPHCDRDGDRICKGKQIEIAEQETKRRSDWSALDKLKLNR